jgi:hypothetical protein
MGSRDGEEGEDKDGEAEKVALVDERRCADAESARARENKNDCHRAETQTDRTSDLSEGACARCDVGGRSGDEARLVLFGRVRWQVCAPDATRKPGRMR